MTASLYQSASSISGATVASGASGAVTASFIGISLLVVIEIVLAAHVPAQAQHVSGHAIGIEPHEVARTAPFEALLGEKIVRLVGALGIEREGPEIELEPPRLDVIRIEVHDDEHEVGVPGIALQEGDELLVVDAHELERCVRLQRRILAANAVHSRDEGA